MRILPAIALLVLLAADLYAQRGEPQAVAGTRVSLVVPAGFVPADRFTGFVDESMEASIMVVELPGPYPQVSAGFSDSAKLAAKGITLLGRSQIIVDGANGLVLRLAQQAHGSAFLKWSLIFGDETETVMITATCPAELDAELSEKLRRSILTAAWERSKPIPPHEGPSFTVREAGDLMFARRVANTLIYTREGIFPKSSVYDPLFLVGQSISRGRIDSEKEFAIARVRATVDVAEIRVVETEAIEINGLSGYEIVAEAKDRDSGEPVLLYYTLLFDRGAYYIVHGNVGADGREEYLKAFREMARSFRRLGK